MNRLLISIFVILVCFNCSSIVLASLNYNVGVVEGYYWTVGDTVNGQYASYTYQQRQQLLGLLQQYGIGIYWWIPQVFDTSAMWDTANYSEWQSTASLATSLGVRAVVGTRPGWLDPSGDFSSTISRYQQIQTAGISHLSVNFDDSAGTGTAAQQILEAQLISNLTALGMSVWTVVPNSYYYDTTRFANRSEWNQFLSYLDTGISNSISMTFTGLVVTPTTMDPTQFPTLTSGRNVKFWDNWIAIDTSTTLSWGTPDKNRVNSTIFTSSYGYILNLCFPLERMIHQIYCLGQMANGNQNCNVTAMGEVWANWLNQNGFLHNPSYTINDVSQALAQGITDDMKFTSIAQVESQYPALTGIFSQPPVTPPVAPPSSSSSPQAVVTPNSSPYPSPTSSPTSIPIPEAIPAGIPTSPTPSPSASNSIIACLTSIIMGVFMVSMMA